MKDDPQTVRNCYRHATDGVPEFDQRAFMDWCERMVCEWKERVTLLGYGWPCWCTGTVGTTQTYHEWLKERVGL